MDRVIDCDQHLYEYRGLWEEHIDPGMRHEAIRFADDALGHVRVCWRDRVLGDGRRADAGRDRRDRRAPPPRARGPAAAGPLRRDPAARLLGAARAARAARRAGRGRGDALPELRARVGARALVRSARAARQHDRVEPLVRERRRGGRRAPPPGRAPHAPRSALARAGAGAPRAGRRARRHDRAGAGRRPPALAPRSRRASGRPSPTTASRRASTSPTSRRSSTTPGTRIAASRASSRWTPCCSTCPPRSP